MSVAIRLSRAGRVHLPYYHISVFDSRTRRDGRPVEQLGFYDPESAKEQVRLDLERAKYWLAVGARPSATVAAILKRQGVALPAAAKAEKPARESRKAAPKKSGAGKDKAAQAKDGKTAKKARKPRIANSKARGEKNRKKAAG
ncbi:MAG: 30S ribosomal protein S16 [Planctomycetota bacterium]|nr:30S ribosomal protein S16 [Planctomycetota bacterium]